MTSINVEEGINEEGGICCKMWREYVLKSSRNKKDLNDVIAALFSVFFFAAGS